MKQDFAKDVFTPETMRKYCSEKTLQNLTAPIDEKTADEVARAMKAWAISKNATHYTHWFQPMTGITAEKHESFLMPNGAGQAISEFSGKELIKGEPDASSFPSGGLRATFEARGYTMWDPTSYAFVKNHTLYIPTLFLSFDGACLDKKTPLLRSMKSLSDQAVRLLRCLGDETVSHVDSTVGCEQEYFLIDRDLYEKRLDLVICSRTLFGSAPVKGQELADHYFATLPERVKAFMEEVDETLWNLGIYAKTEHQEVAPRQFELAPVFTTANTACDHNQITMEVLKSVARHHGFECLLHEKPFAFINGSGKHNNWSLLNDRQENLLNPGPKPEENLRFLMILAAVIKAVDEYQDLLRISVATAGNDHRLGAHEAPPAIVSIYLGQELCDILNCIAEDRPYIRENPGALSEQYLDISKDTTDRNRTSPFAFTGNKFEFRMLGSSDSISCPNTILNTIIAESFKEFADELENRTTDLTSAVRKIIADTMKKHSRILFNGNGYTDEWIAEAKRRGLSNYQTTAEALSHYSDEKNIRLFEAHGVYNKTELVARQKILLDNYYQNIRIEAKTMVRMIRKEILPGIEKYERACLERLKLKADLFNTVDDHEKEAFTALDTRCQQLTVSLENLDELQKRDGDAFYAAEILMPAMAKTRAIVDELEESVPREFWPIPDYNDLLFTPVD